MQYPLTTLLYVPLCNHALLVGWIYSHPKMKCMWRSLGNKRKQSSKSNQRFQKEKGRPNEDENYNAAAPQKLNKQRPYAISVNCALTQKLFCNSERNVATCATSEGLAPPNYNNGTCTALQPLLWFLREMNMLKPRAIDHIILSNGQRANP